jgi:hypothetical protein
MNKSNPIPEGKLVEGDMTVALDSRFLNAIVLQGALEKTGKSLLPVKIDRVEHHDVLKYENGTKDNDVYLMYFEKSSKPLKLAKTNIKRIIMMYGSIGAGWHGKLIGLCLEDDRRPDLGGQKGPCVRVSLINPETGRPHPKKVTANPFPTK